MSDNLLVIDFSHLCCMAWFPALDAQEANPALYDPEKVVLVNIDGKMATIRNDMEKYGVENYQTVFIEDRHAKRKYELFPEYKGNRDKSRPKAPKALIKAHLKARGYRQWAWSDGNEADDAVAAFVAIARRNDMPVVICSGDKDLWQLIDPPGVTLYNPYTNRFVQAEDVLKKFGVSHPKYIPLVKALWGDAGDNIPNVVPRMQKQLVPIIERTDGSWGDFNVTMGDSFLTLSKRCMELWDQNAHRVAVNHTLVKLDPTCALTFDDTP